ncbi:MAG: DUF3105 domain-containing protein [Micrococcaceae bacterium]|nr:DUF3105 domain-containing protein [Micrococcaceae bacterium]
MSSAKNSDQRRQDRAAVLQAHWAAEAKAARKQKVLWGAGGVTAVALVGALVTVAVVTDPPPPTRQDIEIAGLETFEDLDAMHVENPVDYEQDPPVGGDHASTWLNCGVYTEEVPKENAVHSLEHGAVWAAYDPSALSEEEITALQEALPDTHAVVSPYEGLESPITLSAWGAQVAVETPDDERIEEFVAKYWQSPEAPEPGAACTGGLDGPGRVA